MSEERGGRELTPREPGEIEPSGSDVIPSPDGERRDVERFRAAPTAHTVGLTEERGAQIVRQSANARNIVFLAVLVIAIFIPVYWFYESGIPAVGAGGRLEAEADVQYVTDVSRGYELYIANCARCHGEDGKGGIGPPLNDQPKLYNVLTADGQTGTGHLNPNYLHSVLEVGGRYVCGDPNSLMAAWREPSGPLNYRQVEELIAWITASKDVIFEPHGDDHGEETVSEELEPAVVAGWRDPAWTPAPGATPPPACWKAPDGLVPAAAGSPDGTPEPPGTGATPGPDASLAPTDDGTTGGTRQVHLQATSSLTFTDENGTQLTELDLTEGETVEFVVDNIANFDHNFYIGPQDVLAQGNAQTDIGIPTWASGVQTTSWTVEVGDQPLQFGCTVPGHYTTMHGDIVIQG